MQGGSASSKAPTGVPMELDLMPSAKIKARAKRKKDPAAEAAAAKARRQEIIARGLEAGQPMVSMQTVLKDAGLEQYFKYFQYSGFDTMDAYSRKTDDDVERLVASVEKQCKKQFPQKDRDRIWKAIRYRWFQAPGNVKRYINKGDIPTLMLQKQVSNFGDAEKDFSKLEPDRQRMVTRRRIPDPRYGIRNVQLKQNLKNISGT